MDSSEAAHLAQGQTTATGQSYSSELEWPGDDAINSSLSLETGSPDFSKTLRSGQPVFRLLALQSSILPKKQRVAVIDAYPEVQIGRDVQPEGSSTPRIRLKEMEVSKFHATAFWDGARKEWNLVDMGSMHGTYIRSGPVSANSNDSGTRLSQARAASLPRRLRHADQLTIGGTVFDVHIHDDQRPCQHCTTSVLGEIPLFPSSRKSALKRTRDVAEIGPGPSRTSEVDRNPKRALNTLRRSLLTRHDATTTSSTPSSSVSVEKQSEYVDRAARRRLLYPSSRPDSPGLPTLHPSISSQTVSTAANIEHMPVTTVVSAPPAPLPSTNIGHRLLMQQGWSPGNALGALDPSGDRVALIDPLEVKQSENRAGLGMKQQLSAADVEDPSIRLNWKDKEKFKRFKLENVR